jgi:uncharacterized protein YjbJ (UPF0337 family)
MMERAAKDRVECPSDPLIRRFTVVNKDQVEGVGKQIKGAAKDAVGGATGDTSMQVEGKLDKAEGKGVGDVKSDIADKIEE